MSDIILSTGPSIENRPVVSYLGLVSGETILGANFVRDLFANITDDFGGRSSAYEREFEKARSLAVDGLLKKARVKGANAVIGIRFDHLALGANNGMMMVAVSGTAVLVSGLNTETTSRIIEKQYYLRIRESEKGPFTKDQVLELLSNSSILDSTPCRLDGVDEWSTVRILFQE